MLDLIGYSTAPEDIQVAHARIDQFFEWLLSVPWWAVWGFALVSTLWLIWVSWPRPRPEPAMATKISLGEEEEPAADSAHQAEDLSPQYNDLLAFFLEHLEPVASAQWSLQERILSVGVENQKVRELAIHSLSNDVFYSSFSFVANKLASSPPGRVPFRDLVVSIHNSEFNYQQSVDDTRSLACSLGLSIISDDKLYPLWEDWRIKHNALVMKYESIKRDPRFGILFRPLRESKWGGPVPPA